MGGFELLLVFNNGAVFPLYKKSLFNRKGVVLYFNHFNRLIVLMGCLYGFLGRSLLVEIKSNSKPFDSLVVRL